MGRTHVIGQSFDHRLLLAENFVHEESGAEAVILHNHENAFVQLIERGLNAIHVVHANHRNHVVPQFDHFHPVGSGGHLSRCWPECFPDRKQRNVVGGFSHPNQHAFDDGHSQGNAHFELASLAQGAFDIHFAVDFFDVLFDHIHAHATTGNFGHGRSCGKAGFENHFEHVFIPQIAAVAIHQAFFNGLVQNDFPLHAFAIITDGDPHLSTFVAGFDGHGPRLFFVGFSAFFGIFQAMVNGVTNDVHQGVRDHFDHCLVHFSVFALQLKVDLFTGFDAGVMNQANHLFEGSGKRHHAHGHGHILQVAGDAAQVVRSLLKVFKLMTNEVWIARDHSLGNDQLAHQVHEGIEF